MNDRRSDVLAGISQRLLPANLEAEQAFLGAVLANNKALDYADFLRSEHFADPAHARIFTEIRSVISDGRLADVVTLKLRFENSGVLSEIGGTRYLAQLLASMIGVINAGEYANTIREAWMRRELIGIGEDLVNSAFGTTPEPVDEIAAEFVNKAIDLAEPTSSRGSVSFAKAAASMVDRTDRAHAGEAGYARLDTGIEAIDGLWHGLWPGQLYYLMARSRTGKTPAMLQFCRHMARTLQAETAAGAKPSAILIFSLEMTAEDLVVVNVAGESRWSQDEIRAGDIGDANEWINFQAIAKDIGELPIIVDDTPDTDIDSLIYRARAAKRRHNICAILIDYMELIRRSKDQSRMMMNELMPNMGYRLKALSKVLEVPILALRQINKSTEGRPGLDDLPYDGGQAADGVFALHRPELNMAAEPNLPPGMKPETAANIKSEWERRRELAKGVVEFICVKRRGGAMGSVNLSFNGPRQLLEPSEGTPKDELLI